MRHVLIATMLCSCGLRPTADDPAPKPPAEAARQAPDAKPAPEGAPCLAPTDCADGLVCEGEGCADDQPGTCRSVARMCTRDLRPYCGCDGETFRSSGSCPGKRYAHAGPCEASEGG